MNQPMVNNGIRKLALGAAVLLFFLMLVPSVAFADSQYTVKVDRGYLALRTAPAYDYSNEIGELYTGDVVTVKEKYSGDYWWVYSSKYGRSGYVNKNYLKPKSSNYGKYYVKVDRGYLALRTAPAYDYSNEIGELYTGDVVTVEEKPAGDYWWVYSSKYDRSGYVNKNYLTTHSSSYGDYKVKVAKNYLALRTAPAFERSNEIGELYTGDIVTVKEKPAGDYWWVYSKKYGREGYVNKNYLVKI